MKRTGLLLIVFFTLGLIIYVIFRANRQQEQQLGWDRQFALEPGRVHKIFLAHRDGETITLSRVGDYWLLNDSLRARPNAMENLLDAIGRVSMKYRPPESAIPNMVEDLATRGIKVELYDRKDHLLKAYYVGTGTADERGTYMIMEGSDQPYVAYLQGWEGNLRFRYNLKGEDWRDKAIFRLPGDKIESIAVDYPQQQEKSFILERKNGSYSVRPYYDYLFSMNSEGSKSPVPARVESYLHQFGNLGAEAFENDNPRRPEIIKRDPFSIIEVVHHNNDTLRVQLFPIFPRDGRPVERYFVYLDTGDLMLAQHRVIGVVLREYDFFINDER